MANGWMGRWVLVAVALWGCQSEVKPGDDPEPTPEEPVDANPAPPGPPPILVAPVVPVTPPPPVDPAGPWPNVAAKNFTADYGVPHVQSFGLDEAHNVWLLRGADIGVLRPTDEKPTWTSGIGQGAALGTLALFSTVICGGEAGRAYVGYYTNDLLMPFREDVNDPEYQKGDLDAVRLQPDGTVVLEEHITRTTSNHGDAQQKLGIRNTNNWHYDEDRSVLVCSRVLRGPGKGDLFIGTNHGVTMIRGLIYSSHRHPVWDVNGSLRIGYSYALGIGRDGRVLIGNEWKLGILQPPADLAKWEIAEENPWIVDTYVPELNSLEEMDFWRGFTEATDGTYYLASDRFGLWHLTFHRNGSPLFAQVAGLPTNALTSVVGTDDGSVFVGTDGQGLWRLRPDGTQTRVAAVGGAKIEQLLYEPTVSPSMLFVLSNAGLMMLRGY